MQKCKSITLFLIANLLLSACLYRDAMWGGSLLAPLDLGPELFSQYKFMDPDADGTVENHHIIDQFTYDLPLQFAIHRAYHEGEIPWWDPYTYGGRPLLADAHVNGTDPIRLFCYALLPFELGYNWNYILRGIITGLGMFLLLRHLGVSQIAAGVLALTYQSAGWFTLFFGHPWIQGSFVYFPFLWLAWLRALSGNFGIHASLGGLFCGLIFYAGNLQSHTYLPLFAMTFLGALLLKNRQEIPKAFAVCIVSGIIGALFAYPVLVNQIEFYVHSLRQTAVTDRWYAHLLAAPVALCGFYPWSFGTFKTLDATRIIGAGGVAFTLFSGALVSFLSFFGFLKFSRRPGLPGLVVCQSLLLVGIYLLIIATPANVVFYSRSASLAGMGLIVAAGLAVQALLDGIAIPSRWFIRGFIGMVLAFAISSSCLAWFVYPKFRAQIEQKIANDQSSYSAIPSISKMRPLQIARFPTEVSIRNPEAAITLLATFLLGISLIPKSPQLRSRLIVASLVTSALPVFMFHARFRPKQPIELWHRMLAGGDAQREAIRKSRGGLRLDESSLLLSEMALPNSMAALYRVHAVVGYSALQPPSLFRYPVEKQLLPKSWWGDLIPVQNAETLTFEDAPGDSPSRFRMLDDGMAAPVGILNESHNSLTLDISSINPGGSLIRTDTWYPGWKANHGVGLEKYEPCFSRIGPFDPITDGKIRLDYVPTGLSGALPAICTAALLVTGLCLSPYLLRRSPADGTPDKNLAH